MSLKPSLLKSRCPTIAHGLAADPSEPPPITLVPFSSQFTTWPLLVLYQRMSLFLSPLKSWATVQFDETVTGVPVDGMPLATTKSVLAPNSVTAATLKFVELDTPGAIDLLL